MNRENKSLEEIEDNDFSGIDRKADAGIRWNSISLIYTAIIQFVMMVILARLFTPEEYGIMGLVLIIIGFGMVFSDAGVSAAVIHYQQVSKKQLSTLFWLTYIIGFLIFLILSLLSPLISMFYDEPELNSLTKITAIIFLIIPLGQQFETLLRKDLIFKSLALIEVLASTVFFSISIILAYYNWGVISVVIGNILGILVKSILIFFVGLKNWKPTLEFDFLEIKNLVI